MNAEELRDWLLQYKGRQVDATCVLNGELFGGDAGTLEDVYVKNGRCFVLSDWGMAWVVQDDHLEIKVDGAVVTPPRKVAV